MTGAGVRPRVRDFSPCTQPLSPSQPSPIPPQKQDIKQLKTLWNTLDLRIDRRLPRWQFNFLIRELYAKDNQFGACLGKHSPLYVMALYRALSLRAGVQVYFNPMFTVLSQMIAGPTRMARKERERFEAASLIALFDTAQRKIAATVRMWLTIVSLETKATTHHAAQLLHGCRCIIRTLSQARWQSHESFIDIDQRNRLAATVFMCNYEQSPAHHPKTNKYAASDYTNWKLSYDSPFHPPNPSPDGLAVDAFWSAQQ